MSSWNPINIPSISHYVPMSLLNPINIPSISPYSWCLKSPMVNSSGLHPRPSQDCGGSTTFSERPIVPGRRTSNTWGNMAEYRGIQSILMYIDSQMYIVYLYVFIMFRRFGCLFDLFLRIWLISKYSSDDCMFGWNHPTGFPLVHGAKHNIWQ